MKYQRLTERPKPDFALCSLNTRLCALDTITKDSDDDRQRLHIRVLVLFIRQLQKLLEQEVEPREACYRPREECDEVAPADA